MLNDYVLGLCAEIDEDANQNQKRIREQPEEYKANGDDPAQGINTLPGLMRLSFREGRFGPVQAPLNLSNGLKTPTPFRANRISSLVGGVQTECVVADQTTATDLNTLLVEDPKALDFRGDRYTHSRMAMGVPFSRFGTKKTPPNWSM